MSEFNEYFGFSFVKAGEFYLADEPWEGENKSGKWQIKASLNLYDEKYRKADETVYLLICEDVIKYVGEYSYNLADRWLKGNYVNHHKSDEIENAISAGGTVSMWLAVSPYCDAGDIEQLNISKSLENEFLKSVSPEWNKRNKPKEWEASWREKNCIKLNTFVDTP